MPRPVYSIDEFYPVSRSVCPCPLLALDPWLLLFFIFILHILHSLYNNNNNNNDNKNRYNQKHTHWSRIKCQWCPQIRRNKATLRGGFQRPWQTRQMDLRIECGFLISVKSQSHFLNRSSAVPRKGLNLASRVTVGRCFTLFSRRPMVFSLKHVSYYFSFVGRHFIGIWWLVQSVDCLSIIGR